MSSTKDRGRRALLLTSAVIFVAAWVLRFVYVMHLRASPLAGFPIVDELYHVEWARELASGNWLGREVFFRAPLYPYSLGVIFSIFGENLLAARIVQSIYGALAPVALYFLGRRVFDERVARLAAGIGVFYPFFIYFTNELLIVTLIVLLDVVALNVLLRAEQVSTRLSWFGSGVLLGISAIARPSVLVFMPALLVWMWWRAAGTSRAAGGYRRGGTPYAIAIGTRARRVAAAFGLVVAGVCLAIAPVTLRNYVVGHDFVPIASQGGINFYIGNNSTSDGASAVMPVLGEAWQNEDAVRIAESQEGRPLRPSEVSSFWYRAGREFILRNPAAAARLYLRKFVLFWDSYELANNKDIYYFGRISPIFRALRWLNFGVIAPLALLGAVAVARRNHRAVLLILFVLSYMAGVLLFFVNSRFRLPVVPVLILFASVGVLRLVDAARKRRPGRLLFYMLLVAAAALFVGHDFYGTHVADHAQTHMTLGRAAAERGDLDAAVAEYGRAIELSPNYAKAYNSLGIALERLGRDDEALEAYMTAVERDSTLAFARNNIGSFYMRRGDLERARKWLESALALDSRLENAHMNLAMVLAEEGDFDGAEYHLKSAVTVDPEFVDAWIALGRLFEETGRLPQAAAAYRQALAVDPQNVDAMQGLGVVLAMAGRYEEAISQLTRAARLRPGDPAIDANLARVRELAAGARGQ
jgi:Flp pilus assembly protein TadD